MKRDLLIVISIIILIILVVVIFRNFNSSTSINNPTTTNQVNGSNNIIINNFSFNPDTLTIKTGDTVTWTNNDSAVHNIKFDSFTSPNMNTGESYKYTFSTPGTFNYICGIHPTMSGTIIVQ